jgi:hypothetical protein
MNRQTSCATESNSDENDVNPVAQIMWSHRVQINLNVANSGVNDCFVLLPRRRVNLQVVASVEED